MPVYQEDNAKQMIRDATRDMIEYLAASPTSPKPSKLQATMQSESDHLIMGLMSSLEEDYPQDVNISSEAF